jgi:hypothetical protein
MNFLHHLLEGDWSEERAVDLELVQDGLRLGQVWDVTNVLNQEGLKKLYQGDFGAAQERIEQLAKVADLYQHELAASAHDALVAFVHLERRELSEALQVIERYCADYREPQLRISGLGTKAKAQVLLGRLEEADDSLANAARVAATMGRLPPPYHLSSYVCARYLFDVEQLQRALTEGDRVAVRRARKSAAASRGPAHKAAAMVAWRRCEVHRLSGTHAWALGKPKHAFAGWSRALATAHQLGAAPELARAAAEIGLHLALEGAPDAWEGRGRDSHLEQARATFKGLDLDWDLDRLSRRADEGGAT